MYFLKLYIMKGMAKTFSHAAKGLFFLVFAGFLVWFTTQPSVWKDFNLQVTEQPFARMITVNGEGELTVKPDIAIVNLSVVERGQTVGAATQAGNQKMNQVVSFLKGLGVSEDDLKTTNYWLNPDYRYPKEGGEPQIVGYTLNQNVRVKVRDLTKVEEVIDGAVKAGVNQTGQLSFEIDDDSEARAEAREEAFADAREKAEAMASAAGVRLGRVVSFSESGGYYEPPIAYGRAMDMAVAESAMVAPAIEAGSEDVTVNVSVTYEIE